MNIKRLYVTLTMVLITNILIGCTSRQFSPGPQGPVGPAGDVGADSVGPASSDAIYLDDSGNLVTETHDFSGFDEIEITSMLEVEISQGDRYHVLTEVEENAQPYLQVSLAGKKLVIGLDPELAYNTSDAVLRAMITVPNLRKVAAGGVSSGSLMDFQCSGSIVIEVTGVSEFEGQISGCDLNLIVTDSSTLTLRGSVQDVGLKATGASKVDLSGLMIENLESDLDLTSQLTTGN